MHSKLFYIPIVLFALTLIILIGVGIFSPKSSVTPLQGSFPTPTAYSSSPINSTKTTKPQIPIQQDTGKKMLEKVTNRKPLLESETIARKKLVAQAIKSPQEILFTSSLFTITYINAFDLFQVEILNQNITNVKQQAVAWFLQQDLSQEAICNLPVMFIMSGTVADQIRGTNNEFSLLPPGC